MKPRLVTALLVGLVMACALPRPAPEDPAVARAVQFLAAETPRWKVEHDCYSCHNNGDAARALYLWTRLRGERLDPIADTSAWLQQPGQWEHNGGDQAFGDERLARLQFAAALVSADEAGFGGDGRALQEAAARLAADQLPDGAWQERSRLIGSPITYGRVLATYMARRTLVHADRERYAPEIRRADQWFRESEVQTVLDAAAVLLALGDSADRDAVTQQRRSLVLVRDGEAPGGGWGPFVTSAPEVFDTALAILALAQLAGDEGISAMIERGRGFLRARQEPDGGWPATTRPSGNQSYAHRISTTGWAVQALLTSGR